MPAWSTPRRRWVRRGRRISYFSPLVAFSSISFLVRHHHHFRNSLPACTSGKLLSDCYYYLPSSRLNSALLRSIAEHGVGRGNSFYWWLHAIPLRSAVDVLVYPIYTSRRRRRCQNWSTHLISHQRSRRSDGLLNVLFIVVEDCLTEWLAVSFTCYWCTSPLVFSFVTPPVTLDRSSCPLLALEVVFAETRDGSRIEELQLFENPNPVGVVELSTMKRREGKV